MLDSFMSSRWQQRMLLESVPSARFLMQCWLLMPVVSGILKTALYFTSCHWVLSTVVLSWCSLSVLAEPPIGLRISDITKNSISLAWQKPNFDGGSPITGYLIEKREGDSDKWSKANLTNITDTRFTVTGLTQDATYEFRVMAKNAVGSVSNPSIIAGPATCVDTYGMWSQMKTPIQILCSWAFYPKTWIKLILLKEWILYIWNNL